jgi:hypothetical protein
MRTNDKRRNVALTAGEYRLLNDLVRFDGYMGQLASEETIRIALNAGLIHTVGSNNNGRPLVRPTSKGIRHQNRAEVCNG